ncbi:hypothetical protein L228DRAFT_264704 [Xylona heveae TC161]|uniref:Homeobox domain-containing protein n=1 Tax=Xylona heveae (strain CBS 132557 / TC161) TaxID=1328760 RepID=A0A165JIJ8_XYLHT|nr:hypothetical protein L228DRAFT_264704 [Xylona heveae TC161]KZF26287.1 hypothetical protein L228DRAFT_264704 [Xylona heveae TC161]
MAYMSMMPEKAQGMATKPNGAEEHDDADTSSRPRLTREQVWMLEKQFQIHPKPSSDIKRRLAEEAGLSLPRVANWFQNRRAKAKQQRKQGEFKLLQAASGLTSPGYGASHGPDIFTPIEMPPELDLTPTWQHGGQLDDQATGLTSPCQLGSPAELDYGFLTQHSNMSLPYLSDHSGYASFAASETSSPTQEKNMLYMHGLHANHSTSAGFPPSAFSDYGSSRNSSVTWTPAQQIDDPFDFTDSIPQLEQLSSNSSLSRDSVEQECYANFQNPTEINQLQQAFHTASFQYQTASGEPLHQQEQQLIYHSHLPQGQTQHFQPVLAADGTFDADGSIVIAHPEIFSGRNSPSDLISTFNAVGIEPDTTLSPPSRESEVSLDLAARRKRPRPAALGHAALRTHSYSGTTPASPAGKGSFLGSNAPMRRIRSTNNISLLRGRIQKNLPGSAQRSPLPFSTFADAGAFERGYFSGRTPTTSNPMPTPTGSFAPPTPRSPSRNGAARPEYGIVTMDGNQPLVLGHGYSSSMVHPALDLETSLVSPPSTPLELELQARFQRYALNHQSPPQSAGLQMPYGMGEGPITSPTFTSFPTAIHMPQPTYMSPIVTEETEQANHRGNENRTSQTTERTSAGKNTTNNKPAPELLFHQYTPTHKAPPPPRMSPHKPRNYIFTNQGPEDF